jgi:NAD(P)-dependent dehydrogenase (short-subunit alcohol dehydrogenase family)
MILEGRTVLVTGVRAGLGAEVARLALRDGANVVIAARTEKVLEATAGELDPSGERVAWARTDIADPADCEALVKLAGERFGAVHALVQVAAFELAFGGLADADLTAWLKAFDTNVLGSYKLVRAVAPAMREAGGGSIVLIGSQSMFVPQLPQAGYGASKGALLSAMYYLADELGPDRIRVNMVVPSWMWGPPVQAFVKFEAKKRGITEDALLAEITDKIPLGEMTADEEVAEAAIFLASERARKITGQSLLVNGGEMMR